VSHAPQRDDASQADLYAWRAALRNDREVQGVMRFAGSGDVISGSSSSNWCTVRTPACVKFT